MKHIAAGVIVCVSVLSLPAMEQADTIHHNLDELVVTARVPKVEVIPAQTLEGGALQRLNSNSIADALRYFSGVQVKDYGGVGGIKTVNVRSMGSAHTGVVYDGVELGNAQNGQIDLGQFSLDNIEAISLYNGQKSEILQPARDFGSAGTVYIRTRSPRFADNRRYHLRAMVRTGSFDLINPSALAEFRLSHTVTASLNTEWIKSSGKYKFRYRRFLPSGATAYDTTAVRKNGDINAFRVEANVFGQLTDGRWTAKVYHYNSERGVPGAIVNNVWRRGERIWDNNSFAQGSYTQTFGRFSTLWNVKYAYYRTHYVNNDATSIKIDNTYRQQEFYLSTANSYKILPWWHVSLSYDFIWNGLDADVFAFTRPDRFTNLVSVATAMEYKRLKFQGSLLGTFIHDKTEGSRPLRDRHVLTPAAFLYYRIIPGFSARAFYKQSYRMPTFNDLYYADVGNADLSPEKVSQYNFGLLYERSGRGFLSEFRVSADVYYNHVSDKIIAYPKGQQFRWTMLNLGKVDIRGIDISALATINPCQDLYVTLRGQYTFQRAIDVTSRRDSYYRDQIPYVPRHSGSAVMNLSWRQWNLNYSFIYVGERYNQQENTAANYMPAWHTSDLSLSRDFRFGAVSLRALAEVSNLLNRDYDVILNYPMPKRNFRITLMIEI